MQVKKQQLELDMEQQTTQSCPTLCDPMDSNLIGSSVHGILQARTLEWVAISFSKSLNKREEFLKTELDRKTNIVEEN